MDTFLLDIALSTHRGRRRARNEDAVAYFYPDSLELFQRCGSLFMVADGVGSLAGSDKASQEALRLLQEIYYHVDADNDTARLGEAVQRVNTRIYEAPGEGATTLTAAVIRDSQLTVAHVGDSAAFWISGDRIEQLTREQLVKVGISQPAVKLEQAIGFQNKVRIDITRGEINPGDRVLLCTDGITEYLSPEQLHEMSARPPLRTVVRDLVNRANAAGGGDNITVILVEVGALCAAQDVYQAHVSRLNPIVDLPERPIPAPAVSSPRPASAPARDPQTDSRRSYGWVKWLIGLALLAGLGAAGVLYGTRRPAPEATPLPPTATGTPSMTPTPEVTPEAETTSVPVDKGLHIDQQLDFEDTALTYVRIDSKTAAFVLSPGKAYRIEDIYTARDGTIWLRLMDVESGQYGWIIQDNLPAYRVHS